MDGIDVFHQLPLHIDPSTKTITSSDSSVAEQVEEVNRLHRLLVGLETPQQVPAPPAPVNPKRSVQIGKLRESGNASFKKGSFGEAIKMYDLAIKMALDRPGWEASGLVREELAALYNNRAQSYMAQQQWAEGAIDAEASVEVKRIGNVKGWWRRGQCLKEMGRLDEAAEWVQNGFDLERNGPDKGNVGELENLAKEIAAGLRKA